MKKYRLIDIDALSTKLAEEELDRIVPPEELYQSIVVHDEHGECVMDRQVKPEHTIQFFFLKENYMEYLKQFEKH